MSILKRLEMRHKIGQKDTHQVLHNTQCENKRRLALSGLLEGPTGSVLMVPLSKSLGSFLALTHTNCGKLYARRYELSQSRAPILTISLPTLPPAGTTCHTLGALSPIR